jgi:hypothetical protein
VAAVRHLPPMQRAALIIRDVLGFRAAEAAGILERSVDAVNGLLKRAQATIARELPPGERDRSPLPGSAAEHHIVPGSPTPASAATPRRSAYSPASDSRGRCPG